MLAALGAEVWVNDDAVLLWPTPSLAPLDVAVPGDPSSAAFFAALAALSGRGEIRLPDTCLNVTRIGFLRALAAMGARLDVVDERREGGEQVGTVVAAGAELRGITVGGDDVPAMIDEIPLLACVAARADGETVVTGAAELRVKESDRIAAVVQNLRAVGVDAEELPEGLRVVGNRQPLRGAVRTYGDHRIAMAFGVLGAIPGNDIRLDDRGCVGVSYPGFWEDLASVLPDA
jgi:3-phosphoshikimate 1-carboxyvinyltransferase